MTISVEANPKPKKDKPVRTERPFSNSEYEDTEGASLYTHFGTSALNKMRLRGDGPPFIQPARRVLYRKSDLDAWLARHLKTSTSDAGQGDVAPKVEQKPTMQGDLEVGGAGRPPKKGNAAAASQSEPGPA